MKTKSTILITLLVLTAFFLAQTGNKIFSANARGTVNTASILGWPSISDTSDMSISDYEREIERLKEEIKTLKGEKFKFHFDSDKFKEGMKHLAIELDKIKEEDFHFEFDFDSEEFRECMKELGEELKDQKLAWKNFDFDFDFDMEEFNDGMLELKEELKSMKFEFDFDLDMGSLEIEMENLKVEMKKLGAFMKYLNVELKNDGLIEDVDEDVDLVLSEDEMKVNGEKVSDELHQKYLDLYEKHFDKSIEESFRIHSH